MTLYFKHLLSVSISVLEGDTVPLDQTERKYI